MNRYGITMTAGVSLLLLLLLILLLLLLLCPSSIIIVVVVQVCFLFVQCSVEKRKAVPSYNDTEVPLFGTFSTYILFVCVYLPFEINLTELCIWRAKHIPETMKPRCALEAIAMNIFHKHEKNLKEGIFNPAQSGGANWWTLVLDENENVEENTATTSASTVEVIHDGNDNDKEEEEEEVGEDEVGLHFDADHKLEEQTGNIMLHPRISTVTYLLDYGAPTLILNQKSPPMNDTNKITLEKGIRPAWLSHPKPGKHIAFDGRFLHGAPALYFPSRKSINKDDNNRNAKLNEPALKRQKIIYKNKKRYTLLVNIWLNHLVMDAVLLDDDVCSALTKPWEDNKSNLKGDDDYASPFIWNHNVDLTKPTKTEKIKLVPSNVDPAGEDEIDLCDHNVTVKYNPLMSECHAASRLGLTVELELEKGTITFHVGQELSVSR